MRQAPGAEVGKNTLPVTTEVCHGLLVCAKNVYDNFLHVKSGLSETHRSNRVDRLAEHLNGFDFSLESLARGETLVYKIHLVYLRSTDIFLQQITFVQNHDHLVACNFADYETLCSLCLETFGNIDNQKHDINYLGS
ncbi:hypothetical protein T265_05980 [Opisthorchis viverrini]|uniref:Uncharacterized protein n=1 Tax=Opisthorchis viverrini TaxID=6198 RepID=A0A074ZHT9_OPIVI|nr:hypothetical protein T265_05980 [Opisthorchis viverrini]KER26848.1 hypothetical protein T265_05980 [Opisthorchis viverrini]